MLKAEIILLLCLLAILTDSSKGQRADCPKDVMFIVDGSGSICSGKWSQQNPCPYWDDVRNAIKDMVDGFDNVGTQTRVGVIVYSNNAHVIFEFDAYQTKEEVKQAISDIPWQNQNTNTSGALLTAKELFAGVSGRSNDVRNIAILITDGKASDQYGGSSGAIASATALREDEDVRVFAVGITDQIDEDELKAISSPPQLLNQNYFLSETFEGLVDILTTDVKPCEAECQKMDLAFIVDGSGSICNADKSKIYAESTGSRSCPNWDLIRDALKSAVNKYEIGSAGIRVGLVRFGNNAHLDFNLKKYDDQDKLQEAIGKMVWLDQNTNTSGGLLTAKDQLFTVSGGDREDVPNFAVVITDGKSSANYDGDRTIDSANALRTDKDVRIYAIGVTDVVDDNELKGISDPPGKLDQNYFKAENFEGMTSALDRVMSHMTC